MIRALSFSAAALSFIASAAIPNTTSAAIISSSLPAPSLSWSAFGIAGEFSGHSASSPIAASGSYYDVSGSLTPDPTITVGVTTPQLFTNNEVSGNVVYYFTIQGPATDNPVPVIISGNISLLVGSFLAGAQGQLLILQRDPAVSLAILTENRTCAPAVSIVQSCTLDSDTRFSGSSPINDTLNLTVGNIYAVDLIVNVSASNNFIGNVFTSGFANASIDPTIAVDPSFSNANQYSIVVSAGVGNPPLASSSTPSSVPEPMSLVILGTGLMGTLMTTKRRFPAC